MKNMHWTNTSMHLHDETWNHHQYISNGRPLPMPPQALEKLPRTGDYTDTFSYKRHRVQLLFYGALQHLQMLLHVQWSKQDEYLSHWQASVVWNHRVLLCYIKAWGLFFWPAVYGEITVHFPLFIFTFFFLSFEREVHVGKVSPWASFAAVFQRKTQR